MCVLIACYSSHGDFVITLIVYLFDTISGSCQVSRSVTAAGMSVPAELLCINVTFCGSPRGLIQLDGHLIWLSEPENETTLSRTVISAWSFHSEPYNSPCLALAFAQTCLIHQQFDFHLWLCIICIRKGPITNAPSQWRHYPARHAPLSFIVSWNDGG